jgi:hypothetical protein
VGACGGFLCRRRPGAYSEQKHAEDNSHHGSNGQDGRPMVHAWII